MTIILYHTKSQQCSFQKCSCFSGLYVSDSHDGWSERMVLDGGVGITILSRLSSLLEHESLEARPASYLRYRHHIHNYEYLAAHRRRRKSIQVGKRLDSSGPYFIKEM